LLSFDGAADEHADFFVVVPRNYASGGFTLTLVWSANGSSQAVVWDAAFRRYDTSEDIDSAAHTYDYNSATATSNATQGVPTYTTIAFTDGADADSIAVGEMAILRIRRDADNASDTSTVDAYLHSWELKET